MYAHYRTTCYGTAIQQILRGSVSGLDPSDVIIVKGTSLELRKLTRLSTETSTPLLIHQFEQSVFGIINDARLLKCRFVENGFAQTEGLVGEEDLPEDSSMMPYTMKIRQDPRTRIPGDEVIVAVSDYGNLVFWTITSPEPSRLAEYGRFEILAQVQLDEPGIEYTKVGKKIAIDPHSRAIAIASYQDRFDIMFLNETMSRSRFDPIIGMGLVEEQGIIWHMEFLYTEETSYDRILLALTVYK
ncbi:hypothetical protein EC973_002446 [Apophysomyces ossiformis]|uniref:RSE1/DDB1/CPSF1 first beta-propeller domain-containing protein n=1 Tax=Apophysomyces ossiformis TaxID=679940 RepID=A0A8H7EMV6_9FUNG|nr:hypothetical protein EC973_002446 [Apophysomyces ossiformis]